MFEKLYDTCELLTFVTITLFTVSILVAVADPPSNKLSGFLLCLTSAFLVFLSLLFFGTLLADIWI